MEKKIEKIANVLDKYMQIDAISRHEEPIVKEMIKNIDTTKYEVSRDGLGSIIFFKKSKQKNAPKIMLVAHMDEVGFLVRIIDKSGQLLVSKVGGIWPNVVIGTKAKVVNKDNKQFIGVFGHTSIHILEKEKFQSAVKDEELYVDLGFSSDKEVQDAGIEIGDRIFLSGETLKFPNNIIGGKAMDNRAGVTAVTFIANNLKDIELNCDLYIVGSAQEEVGTRGAKTAVSIVNPDVAFAIDTGASHDTLNCKLGTPKLGYGAAVLVQDSSTLMDPKLIKSIMEIAKEKKILAYKYIAEGGGTDAAALQYGQGGVATVTISIPQRYLHSPIGLASLVDIDATIELCTEFIKNFSREKLDTISYKI